MKPSLEHKNELAQWTECTEWTKVEKCPIDKNGKHIFFRA